MTESGAPIRVYIDISLFTEDDAFGRISGPINVPVMPQIGDLVYLDYFSAPVEPEAFACTTLSAVTARIIPVNGEADIQISLSDLTVKTKADAKKVMAFLEERYDLFGEPHSDGDMTERT